MGFQFAFDAPLALLSLLMAGMLLVLWLWMKGEGSHLLFSDLSSFGGEGQSWRVRLAFVPGMCRALSFALLLLALPNPRLTIDVSQEVVRPPVFSDDFDEFEEQREVATEGIALYLVLDQSGSMEKGMVSNERSRRMPRIEVLKRVTTQFIRGDDDLDGRPNDMIGLVSFARVAHVLCPLTLDRGTLLKNVRDLKVVGSSREDGTAIGYAIFKTANLITATRHFAQELESRGKPAYEIKSSAMVMVTDGLQNPHPLDAGHELRQMEVIDAARYAAEQEIKLYIINVEPMVMAPQYIRQREELQGAAEMTGGKFFVAGDTVALKEVYKEIDKLERSQLPGGKAQQAKIREGKAASDEKNNTEELLLYPYFVGAALFFLFVGGVLQTTWLRRVL
jgi:Ca-activated chloride channel homolog